MSADSRVKADPIDDVLGIQSAHLCIGIKLIKIGNSERQIGICKKLHCLCFRGSHKKRHNLFLNSALLKQSGKGPGRFLEILSSFRHTYQ